MDIYRLSLPFPRNAISWRIQGSPRSREGRHYGMALAYIDARDVMDRLDEVCGPSNWQNTYSETPTGRVIGSIGIRVDGEWVWKSDGAGSTAVEAEKGGISDALKRAAVNWGVGRYLYGLDSVWCECEVSEKSGKTYFKKWIGSPWDRVKNAPQEPSPSEILAAVHAIGETDSMEALAKWWSGTFKAARHIADNAIVYAAKEARKAELSTGNKEAA